MKKEVDVKELFKKLAEDIDLKQLIIDTYFDGFDNQEDYEKYGDAFVKISTDSKVCSWKCWGSTCRRKIDEKYDNFCSTHIQYRCRECGQQSTHGCSHYWGPGVCGTPYCDAHSKGKCLSCGNER
jgi:hypothetical protein